MNWSYPTLFFIITLTIGCGKAKQECPQGKPTPIFSDHPSIQQYQFSADGQTATERIVFSDSLQLTVVQEMCEHIQQQLQFEFPGDYQNQPTEFWVAQATEFMQRIGSMGLDYQAFSSWAQLIEAQQTDIRLAESTELQPGFFVQIDRVTGANNATLVLTLSDTP